MLHSVIFIMILIIHNENSIDNINSDIHCEIMINTIDSDNYHDIHGKFDIDSDIHHDINNDNDINHFL